MSTRGDTEVVRYELAGRRGGMPQIPRHDYRHDPRLPEYPTLGEVIAEITYGEVTIACYYQNGSGRHWVEVTRYPDDRVLHRRGYSSAWRALRGYDCYAELVRGLYFTCFECEDDPEGFERLLPRLFEMP